MQYSYSNWQKLTSICHDCLITLHFDNSMVVNARFLAHLSMLGTLLLVFWSFPLIL